MPQEPRLADILPGVTAPAAAPLAAPLALAPLDALGRRVQTLLVGLCLFDAALVVWVLALPDLWFRAFHGVERVDPQALLTRMGANWAAFALVQGLAAWRWRRWPGWVLVVAGVRLSDMFTDVSCVLACTNATWFAWATLPLMSLLNLLMGVWLLRAWSLLQRPA